MGFTEPLFIIGRVDKTVCFDNIYSFFLHYLFKFIIFSGKSKIQKFHRYFG